MTIYNYKCKRSVCVIDAFKTLRLDGNMISQEIIPLLQDYLELNNKSTLSGPLVCFHNNFISYIYLNNRVG